MCRLAANVVWRDERLGDAGAVPHRDSEWLAVTIRDPIEARSQAPHGGYPRRRCCPSGLAAERVGDWSVGIGGP
jgi:hypothetical protein